MYLFEYMVIVGDSIVDFTVHLYWYNNSYTYRAAVNNGSIQPTFKGFFLHYG